MKKKVRLKEKVVTSLDGEFSDGRVDFLDADDEVIYTILFSALPPEQRWDYVKEAYPDYYEREMQKDF